MLENTYRLIEDHMLLCMNDSSHDRDHVYRVLYTALDIACTENDVDFDVLISACLLHDIGRREQFENPDLD
ncbi:MAG: HD domain-containing protein, partial [Oscillospiraceae bacterium]|nr:HD domain-containing protein [Oscillospiraceae bacterium]